MMNEYIDNRTGEYTEDFQSAFDQACDEQLGEDTSASDQQEEQIEEPDVSIEEEQQEPVEESKVVVSEPSNSVDYKTLYEELKRNSDAQLGRLHANIQTLSAQYQELKQSMQQKKEEPKEEEPTKLPSHIQEVFEAYPEIADAVQYLVDSKLSKTQKQFQNVVESKITPIQNQLYLTEAQKHEATIRASHPDITEILMSGDLHAWMNTLTPVSRAGAMRIYESGSAEEIVSMLNEYKQARGIPTNGYTNVGKQSPAGFSGTAGNQNVALQAQSGRTPAQGAVAGTDSGTSGTQDESEDEIVKRVLAAMTVASSREPLDVPKRRSRSPKQDFMAVAKEYERSTGRRLPY